MEMRRWAAVGGLVTVAGGYAAYRRRAAAGGAVGVQRSITVEKPRDEVYRRWRDPETQPLVWSHFAELTNVTDAGAHWRVDAPLGRGLEWESRIVEARGGELIRWESEGGVVANEGTVEFRDAPGDRGTEIALRARFNPPGGPLGGAAVRLAPTAVELLVAKALRRFKSLVEAGEVPSTDQNPSARAS